MADAKKCDRCGCFYGIIKEKPTAENTTRKFNKTVYKDKMISLVLSYIDLTGNLHEIEPVDLCRNCSEELNKWVNYYKETEVNNES